MLLIIVNINYYYRFFLYENVFRTYVLCDKVYIFYIFHVVKRCVLHILLT